MFIKHTIRLVYIKTDVEILKSKVALANFKIKAILLSYTDRVGLNSTII